MQQTNHELLEIYKLHVEMSDKVSERRGKTNQFYVSLLSAILVGIGFFLKELDTLSFIRTELFLLIVSILGISLCVLWWFNIKSYRQLNTLKFRALHELEAKLAYSFYEREWILAGKKEKAENDEINRKRIKYFQLTKVEQFSPLLLAIPYLSLLIYSISKLFL
jgi:hypothetical protein